MHLGKIVVGISCLLFLTASGVAAHCDTLAGPVVADVRKALASGEVALVLKWVRSADEADVRTAFQKTIAARAAGAEAREIADRWFAETVVRLHRASEGEPFTGLKSDAVPEPLALADASIESGDAGPLIQHLTRAATDQLRERFREVREAHAHAGESVEAGRRYVVAYISFMRLVEQLTGGSHVESHD